VLVVSGSYSECGTESVLVADESPAQVALSVRVVVVGSLNGTCNRESPPLEVRLAAPLGKRGLVDEETGKPVVQFSARLLLRPRVLPPGYRPWQVQPELAAPPLGTQSHPVAGASLWYSPWIVANAPDVGALRITEFPDPRFLRGSLQAPMPRPNRGWTRISVRGVQGWAAPYGIAWRQHALDFAVDVFPAGGNRPPLSTAQLIAVADSLTTWTGPLPGTTGPA
jgi:hypothetical protein